MSSAESSRKQAWGKPSKPGVKLHSPNEDIFEDVMSVSDDAIAGVTRREEELDYSF